MSTSSIGALGASNSAAAAAGANPNNGALNENQFLQLLVTQLRNQDPLNPLQPSEFAAQLAQFSGVEQLTKLNDAVSVLQAQNSASSVLGASAFSASLVGKTVVAEGDRLVVASDKAAKATFEVGAGGGEATLVLKDDAGKEVARRDLGAVASGRQTLTLPADLPAGTYHYAIEVKGKDGASVPTTTYVTGTVDGVRFQQGTLYLSVDGLMVGLDGLVEIGA
jgi:flagellar basal-body rod modification protein FlgD